MALTATFAADFQDFLRGLESAQVKLQVFDRATKNAARSLTRELESISGQKVATEAARMAEAVKRLGGEGGVAAGLLKLTDDELKRVTATMDAATAKAAKLGEALPDSLKQVNAEIAKLPKPVEASNRGLGLLDATFGKLTASFAAASIVDRVVGGIADFGAKAIASAGDLVDLNKATNVSVETLQRWRQVARLGGIELETMTTASFKLGAALDGGGKSVRDGVAKLGLEFTRLQGLQPERQMHEILVAADRLGESQSRNTALIELFGNRGAQALARIVDGYEDTARAASVASDEQIAALDRAADRWDTFLHDIETGFAAAMGRIVMELENLDDAPFGKNRQGFIGGGEFDPALAQEDSARQALLNLLADAEAKANAVRERVAELQRRNAVATADYVGELARARSEIAALSPEQRKLLDATLALDRGFEAVATRFGLGVDAQRLYTSVTKESAKASSEAAKDHQKFAEQLAQLGGSAALAGATQAMDMLQALGGPLKVLPSQLDTLRKRFEAGAEAAQLLGDTELAEFYAKVAQDLAPINAFQSRYNVTLGDYVPLADTAAAATQEVADQMARLTGQVQQILPPLKAAGFAWSEYRTAVAENDPDTPFFDIVREHLDTLEDHLASSANAFARLGQVSGRGMGQVAEAVAVAATAVSDFNDILSEVAEGDKLGAVLAAAKLGANLAASLWDGLTSSAGEKAAREAGRDFGVWISEEMGNAIAADAAKLFDGDRFAASVFNLSDIIGAAGGLTDDNLARMTARLRDVFVLVETGSFTSAQAVAVLDENFQDFIEAATDGSGRLSQEMVEIIRLTREFGLESEAVTGYVREQAQAAIAGANAVIGYLSNQYDAYQDIADGVREAQQRIDALNRTTESGRGIDWTRDMQQAQADLTRFLSEQHAAGEAVRGELELVGQIAVGVYGAAIEAGLSHSEALKAALPGLTQLVTAYENLGISAQDAGLAALLPQAELARNNPQLLAGVDGLAQSFTALSNLGLLNADTFQQMEQAALMMFSRIQGELAAQGVDMSTNLQALIPLQDYLRAAAEQADLLGIALDPTTQMLIDQSKELGLWKDEGEDAGESLQDTMRELRDVFKELADAMKQVPRQVTTDVTTRYHQEGGPTTTPGGGPTPEIDAGTTAAAQRAGRGGGDITTRVYLDGREVAMAVAPHRRAAERAWGAD